MTLIDDITEAVDALQASTTYGPYAIFIGMENNWFIASRDRRYMRRKARKLGLKFKADKQWHHPRLYFIYLDKA